VDPDDYASGQHLDNIVYTDAAMESFFTYCHLAGPKLCDFYTGTTISDIAARFENLFVTLNATEASAKKFSNASIIIEALAMIKATIRQEIYEPITFFPATAKQLVAYESVLKDLTIEGINAASQLGVHNTGIPGTVNQLPEWQTAVLCTDAPPIYGKAYQAMKPQIDTIEEQSFVAGEVWAGFIVSGASIVYG
jgi:hypothetical protein